MMILDEAQISDVVTHHAKTINSRYQGIPYTVLVCLKGGFAYGSSLILQLRGPLFVEFCQPSSYKNNVAGELTLGNLPDIQTSNLLIVDDIWGTGKTLNALKVHYEDAGHNVALSCLLTQSRSHSLITEPHYTDQFGFGFGLDNNSLWRNLPFVTSL